MFDESHISDETHHTILSQFPDKYKSTICDCLVFDKSQHDQLFIIYYNDYHNNRIFSFEHLCRVINEISEIPINKIINKFRKNGEWTLSEIPDNKLSFIVEKMLSHKYFQQ